MRLSRSRGAARQGVRGFHLAALALSALVLPGLTAVQASATTFSNAGSITLNDPDSQSNGNNNATATPYPSTIAVSGLTGTLSSVTVTLNNVSYSFSQDIDALLVGPGGQTLIPLASLGPNGGASAAASNSTLTLSDAGTSPTMLTPWGSASTFKPVNFGGFNEVWEPPAPIAPYGNPGPDTTVGPSGASFATQFGGTNPNGTWKLYLITTAGGDGTGAVAGGWSLNITTASAPATTTTVSSNLNPSFTAGASSSVTLTAAVASTSTVSEGTVDFTDNGVTISGCGAQAVSAGQATCTTTFSTEGVHGIKAQYGGTANFGASNSATIAQQVDNHTTVTGSSYCNTGSITLNNPAVTTADDSPYPSHVFISGLSGTLSHLTVSLNGATYGHSQDIDALLVGPTGEKYILVAAAGPNSSGAISNVTLTLDDNAASTISATAPWGSPNSTVTSKPVNYGGVNETWNSPAPAGPYDNPGPADGGTETLGQAFDGSNPNGTWSLYVVTTAAGDGTGAIAGGWCANVTAASAAATTTTLTSNNNPSFTTAPGNTTTLTATVKKSSDSSNVSEGTVDFTDNGITIPGCGAVSVSAGNATCTTAFTTEGVHSIQALYSGDANFGGSSATLSQDVNDHTTVTGNSYCNSGSIGLNNPTISSPEADASPYPSEVFVTGNPGNTTHLTVTLNGVTYSHSQDVDGLLVGPGGQTLILVAAAGPNSGGALSNVTLTLDDNAAQTITSTGAWGAANSTVTSKPVNYGGVNEVFGPPAPAGPYGNPGPSGGGTATLGSTFNGVSANGTWSLYLITTAGGDGTGAAAGGWCLGVTGPHPPTLSKSFAASSVPLNGSTAMSFTVSNPNASQQLTGVGFTDTLPAGLVVSTPNGASGSCGGGTITRVAGSSSVSLSGATLAASSSCTFSVSVTGTSAGSKVNTTSAPTSTEGGSGTPATATLAVVAPPTLTKSFGAPSINLGSATSLSFTVANLNTASSLSGVGFTDTLPSGLAVSTPNALSGLCGGGTITATAGSGVVSLSGATLAAASSCTFTVNVTGTSVGSQVNTTSTVSSTEGGSGAAATATVNVAATAVHITKAFGAASIPTGGSTVLSFTISNPANNGPATGVAFTDALPAGLVVSTPNGLTGGCGGGTVTATAGSSAVSLSAATLAAAASCTFTVNVTGTSAGVKSNSVTVSSNEGGTGNTANASVTVVAPPLLTKVFGAPTIALNGTTTLSFTASNPNTTTSLTGVGFTDALPTGLVVATPNGLTGSCGGGTITATAAAGSVSLSGATLSAAASCTFTINVTGTSAGSKVNTTSVVSSNEGGSGTAATATVAVAAGPPQISKSFGAASIPTNGSTTLSFTINNPAANGSSTGVGFTDTLPAGLVVATPNGLTGSCGGGTIGAAAGSGSVSLSGATLAGGASCTFSVSVTGASAGVKSNSVTVSSTNGGTGNTATASVTVVDPPSLVKFFGAASVPLTGSTSLTFSVTDPNATTTLTGVGFTDTLPAGLVVSTPSGLTSPTGCGSATITASAGATSVTVSGATVAPGPGCTFAVNVTSTAAGSQVNTTSVVSSNEGGSGPKATATLSVVAPPVIAKAFGAATVPVNGTTSLTFTLTNPNTGSPLNGVAFTDTFPAGLVVATPSGAASTCADLNGTVTPGSGVVSATGILIPAGGTCTFSVNVTAATSGTKLNSVTVTSTNGGTGNTAQASLQVALPPVIVKAFGAATIPLNGSTSLSFTITNPAANGSQALSGVSFTDTLPAGLVVATPSGVTGSCGGGTIGATAGSGSVSLSGATLAGGASCTFSVSVTGTSAGVKSNSVTVSSMTSGAGNTATASIIVVAPPTISKAFGAAAVPVGGSTSLSFTVSNPNSAAALSGVAFTDSLPAGLVVSTPSGLTGSCGGGTITATAGAGSIALSGAALASSATCTFSVKVTGTTAGVKENSVTASSTNGGAGAAGTASLTVVAPPRLAKAFGVTSLPFGATTTLTFTVSNTNAGTALHAVGFTDALPSGLVVASPNGLTGSCGGGTIAAAAGGTAVSLSGATLVAASSCSFSVGVTGIALGVQNNTTSAVTSTEGGNGGPATASVTVGRAPTTVTVVALPSSAAFGSPITFTATVAPSQPNGSGVNPTGTVAFLLDGGTTPVATIGLVGGMASFTTSGLSAGNHTVVAVYSGDANFLGATSSTPASVTLTCATTITGSHSGTTSIGAGATCLTGAHLGGAVLVHAGASVDIENSTISGPFAATGAAAVRICGSTINGSVDIEQSTGLVIVGDPADECAGNTITGSLIMHGNTGGVVAVGNTVSGATSISGNSGPGPFPG